MKVQMVTLHISSITVPLFLIILSTVFFDNAFQLRIRRFLPVYWIGAMVYVLVLWFLAEVWDKMFTRDRNAVEIAVMGAVLLTGVSYLVLHEWLLPAIMFPVLTIYVGLFWSVTNTDHQEYNRYYAILSANRILNPAAVATSYRGKAASGFWRFCEWRGLNCYVFFCVYQKGLDKMAIYCYDLKTERTLFLNQIIYKKRYGRGLLCREFIH